MRRRWNFLFVPNRNVRNYILPRRIPFHRKSKKELLKAVPFSVPLPGAARQLSPTAAVSLSFLLAPLLKVSWTGKTAAPLAPSGEGAVSEAD